MNLPNKLTVLRVILIPFFVFFLLFNPENDMFKWIALGIFIVASLTDMLDGKIARKYNLITDFGKFMDPLADKLLVCSAMIGLIELGRIPSWIVIVIIAREFVISGFRLIAADNGRVIAASYWGKFKTTFQMIMVILMIANLGEMLPWYNLLTQVIMWIALALTIISLIDYLIKNKDVMSGDM
ncbi:CDP-diacylglycerol--glycerol-3-phosphate 3-phosphatidyltransferase [Butyrivibrio proteoclasticus]|uniref:CDP-diacylglycerol--glycerol-3-phosphate 3-phosphatidyltransferase n=1 Tax=Butyrivibrio proteoclasticus TaxID=43305 RepID=UPI0004792B8B|nr:CDP-diacylglycerol--glycerol-3-phosphate 3-phosphatidyltransferase [Butyrivibrio proteoclasticus]